MAKLFWEIFEEPLLMILLGHAVKVAFDLMTVIQGYHSLWSQLWLWVYTAYEGNSWVFRELCPQIGVEQRELLCLWTLEIMARIEWRQLQYLICYWAKVKSEGLDEMLILHGIKAFNPSKVNENVVIHLNHSVRPIFHFPNELLLFNYLPFGKLCHLLHKRGFVPHCLPKVHSNFPSAASLRMVEISLLSKHMLLIQVKQANPKEFDLLFLF